MSLPSIILNLPPPILKKNILKKGEDLSIPGSGSLQKTPGVGGMGKNGPERYFPERQTGHPKNIEYHTRSSEAGHTLIALLVFLTAAFLDSLVQAKWLLVTNLLLNFYPVMLQRYNRSHYRRILQRHELSRV